LIFRNTYIRIRSCAVTLLNGSIVIPFAGYAVTLFSKYMVPLLYGSIVILLSSYPVTLLKSYIITLFYF
jgi:hypothetical protein